MASTQVSTSTSTQHQHYHHEHHHHHHHVDQSEVSKQKAFRSIKLRAMTGKILSFVLTVFAIALMCFVYWIYTTK